MTYYRAVAAFLIMLAVPLPSRGESSGWTVPRLLDEAERVSPAVAAAQADLMTAQGARRQDGLYPNPQAGVERAGDLIYRLDQHIESPGSRRARLDMADQEIASARVRVDEARLEVRSEVEETAYQLLAARERRRLIEDNVQLLVRLRATLPNRYRPGLQNSAETLRVDLETARTQNDLRQARAQERLLESLLNAFLLQPSTAPIELSDALDGELPPVDISRLRDLTFEHNNALRLAQWQTSQAEAQLRLARKSRIPSPDVGINIDRPLDETVYLVGFEASVPLPLWNSNQGDIQAASARLDAARDQTMVDQQAVLADLSRAYEEYQSARERIQAFTSGGLLQQSLKMRTEVLQAYEQGLMNLTDLLDSLRTSTQAQEDYLQSLLDGQAARIALAKDTGGRL